MPNGVADRVRTFLFFLTPYTTKPLPDFESSPRIVTFDRSLDSWRAVVPRILTCLRAACYSLRAPFSQTSGFFKDSVRRDSIQDALPLNDDVKGGLVQIRVTDVEGVDI